MCTQHHLLTLKLLSQMYTFSRYNRQSYLHYNLRTDCFSILCSIQREGQPDRNHTVVMTPCRAVRLHHIKYSLHHHVYRTYHPTNTICKPGSCRTAYEGAVTSSATQEHNHSCGTTSGVTRNQCCTGASYHTRNTAADTSSGTGTAN